MRAKFRSTCPICSKAIQPGEAVYWKRGGRAQHPICAQLDAFREVAREGCVVDPMAPTPSPTR